MRQLDGWARNARRRVRRKTDREHRAVHSAELAAMAVTMPGVAREALENMGLNVRSLRRSLLAAGPALGHHDDPVEQDERGILERADSEAAKFGSAEIGTEPLRLAVLANEQCPAAKTLEDAGVTAERLRSEIVDFCGGSEENWPGPSGLLLVAWSAIYAVRWPIGIVVILVFLDLLLF